MNRFKILSWTICIILATVVVVGAIWLTSKSGQDQNNRAFSTIIEASEEPPIEIPTCNNDATPGWGESLGTVSFVTNQTWKVGNQEWSDAVQATNCNKTAFYGGWYDDGEYNFRADCRSNPNQKGDLFSWCAVARFGATLCPTPWRVPTVEDFIALDEALGGTGDFNVDNDLLHKYFNFWGGAYGGYCDGMGVLHTQGSNASYWSQTKNQGTLARYLNFDMNFYIYPQGSLPKRNGFTLRCVR
jgi:uncharacterized protein (TIGR02145 family)